MKKNIRVLLLLLSLLALFSFYFFSCEVKQGFLKQTDFNVTVRLQNHVPKRFDEMWEDVAIFVTPVSAILIVGFLTIAAFANKKIWLRALIIPILFGALVMGELYGKSVVRHPAPPFFMIKNPTTIFPQFYVNEQYSYPSGHTARAVFVGMTVWVIFRKRRWVAIVTTGFVLLVAIGRIYLGHHWLSDVLGGGLIGSGLGLLTLTIISPIIDKQ